MAALAFALFAVGIDILLATIPLSSWGRGGMGEGIRLHEGGLSGRNDSHEYVSAGWPVDRSRARRRRIAVLRSPKCSVGSASMPTRVKLRCSISAMCPAARRAAFISLHHPARNASMCCPPVRSESSSRVFRPICSPSTSLEVNSTWACQFR